MQMTVSIYYNIRSADADFKLDQNWTEYENQVNKHPHMQLVFVIVYKRGVQCGHELRTFMTSMTLPSTVLYV
jgi:hypothetical protein